MINVDVLDIFLGGEGFCWLVGWVCALIEPKEISIYLHISPPVL